MGDILLFSLKKKNHNRQVPLLSPLLPALNVSMMPGAAAAISCPQDKGQKNRRGTGPDTAELLNHTGLPPTTRFLVM